MNEKDSNDRQDDLPTLNYAPAKQRRSVSFMDLLMGIGIGLLGLMAVFCGADILFETFSSERLETSAILRALGLIAIGLMLFFWSYALCREAFKPPKSS